MSKVVTSKAPPNHGERHRYRQLQNEVTVVKRRREAEHHAESCRCVAIAQRITPTQPAIRRREDKNLFDIVMVEHAYTMQFAGQAGERKAERGERLQGEAQLELSRTGDDQRGADGDRDRCDVVQHREQLLLGNR